MNSTRRTMIVAAWVILLSFVALSAATYAWMSIATSYRVSDFELNVITENAMEIAVDNGGVPGEWGTVLTTDQLFDPEATLSPVTWSAKDKVFYAPSYGLDGRISFLERHLVTDLSKQDIPTPSADEAEEGEGAGYLLSVDLWVRTGASGVTAFLSGPVQTAPDKIGGGSYCVGLPQWDAETDPENPHHIDVGNGAERAIRIGILTYDEDYEAGRFYIYEPNAGGDTPSIDEGGDYAGDGKLIRQSVSRWVEQEPILHDHVNYELGEFEGDTALFALKANTPRRITLFVWLEGQDTECQNSISAGELLIGLQFGADVDNSGNQGVVRPNRENE